MKKEIKIELYCVTGGFKSKTGVSQPSMDCSIGVIHTNDWQPDLELAKLLYDRVSSDSFSRSGSDHKSRIKINSYKKTLKACKISKNIFDHWVSNNTGANRYRISLREKINILNSIVLSGDHVSHLHPIISEAFNASDIKLHRSDLVISN